MTARDVWRWTDERGVQRLVGTDELRAALSSGVLPPTTLVWREGMKEWLPASSMPELASAAFAASEASARPSDGDPRRSTLVGISSAAAGPPTKGTKVPVAVPATGERTATTQIPPFGAPGRGAGTPVPPAPRVLAVAAAPSAGTPGLAATPHDLPKPKRKGAMADPDAPWATTTHSDEDETIPRRARPSELAAAAAAAAEAAGSLRDLRTRAKLEAEGRRAPGTPPVSLAKPPVRRPPPLPAKAKLDAGGDVAPKENPPARPSPPARPPPIRAKPPAPPAPTASAPKPAERAPPPVASVAVPIKPVVRVKDAPPAAEGPAAVSPGPAAAAPAPVADAHDGKGSTLVGVASPVQAAAASGAPAPAAASSAPAAAAPPPAESGAASGPTPPDGKTAKTLVSPSASIKVVPVLDDAVASVDVGSEITIPAPMNGVAARPAQPEGLVSRPPTPIEDTDSVTSPSRAMVAAALVRAGVISEPSLQPAPPAAPTFGALPPEGDPGATRREWGPTPLPPIAVISPLGASPQPPPVRADVPPVEPAADAGGAPQPTSANGGAPPMPGWSPAAFSVPPSAESSEPELALDPSAEPVASGPEEVGVPGVVPRRRILDENVSVPISSLLGSGGVLIGMVVAAFFVGRASTAGVPRLVAHASFKSLPVRARAAFPPPPRPCWMSKQPAMWAAHASRSIPFEAVATKGGALALGYARDSKEAMGIQVDLVTGEVKKRFDDKSGDEIERVVPTSAPEFRVMRTGGSKLTSAFEVPVATPFAVGLAAGAVAIASPPSASPSPLWPVAGEEALGAAAIHAEGDRGFALTYRRGGAVWGGFIGADRKAQGALVKVNGSGGSVGKPGSAWNGRELAVVFADRPEGASRYEIRIGHAPAGAIPTVTTVFPLPRGGPGGDAFAPDIAGLDDGRWVLMWTEGAQGTRAVRAQTLAPDFRPLGDPIALSPPAGNFGQGATGVVGNHVATVFLSKGSSNYELWGAVLQCGG